ncbi:MAG: DNA polymerase I, partial [Anaerolineae bacterium]|nr:DNA polymerase I [Anaerolineae bacterium]NIN96399.1 DNA polymerase I [Anaerolineae bacterium]NIQ79435.1 DNA polymerase I [Anaerolineae bacterium]
YTTSLLEYAEADGRIHAAFLQVNAASGRYTSREPNFQNLPRDSKLFDIRSAFIPDPGHVFVVYDFVQMEFKLAAAYSQDPLLVAAANDPEMDVHSATARAIFGLREDQEVESVQRQAAKTITFAILYGITPYGLARQLQCSEDRAKFFIKKFYQQYQGLKRWINETRQLIRQQGYVETYYGRRRWADMDKVMNPVEEIRDGEFRKLANTVIQGSGADFTKIAMKQSDKAFREEGLDAEIVGQIHDELVVLCPEGQADRVEKILEVCMTQEIHRPPTHLSVKLPVDGKIKLSLSKSA